MNQGAHSEFHESFQQVCSKDQNHSCDESKVLKKVVPNSTKWNGLWVACSCNLSAHNLKEHTLAHILLPNRRLLSSEHIFQAYWLKTGMKGIMAFGLFLTT